MSAAVVQLAKCWASLGCGENDPMRAVWDVKASQKDRRLLLAMAGASVTTAAACVNKAWGDLKPAMRGDIKRGLQRFKGWAEKLEGGDQ